MKGAGRRRGRDGRAWFIYSGKPRRRLPPVCPVASFPALPYHVFMRPGDFLSLVEIRTKVISLSSFALGTLHAAWAQGAFSPLRGAVMMAATLAVDMGTTAWNSYFDYLRDTDNPRFNREPDKVLVHGGISPAAAFFVSLGLFAAAVPLGLAVAFLSGLWVVPVGALCMAVGFLYTGGPFPLSRTPLGELFAGGFLGSALFLISWGVQAAPAVSAEALGGAAAASLPSFILVASILTVNNVCDIDGDRESGRRTLAILLGRKRGELLVYCMGAAAFSLAAVSAFAGNAPRGAAAAALVSAAYAAGEYGTMRRRGFGHATKGPNMGGILRVFTVFSLCRGAAYALALAR